VERREEASADSRSELLDWRREKMGRSIGRGSGVVSALDDSVCCAEVGWGGGGRSQNQLCFTTFTLVYHVVLVKLKDLNYITYTEI